MSGSIGGLDHVQVSIPRDGERLARAFYADLLGLTEVPKPEALRARGGCWFHGGAAVLHLGVEEPFLPARKAHPAFRVDDLDALAARLRAADVECTFAADVPGVHRFHCLDPFGNRLEFVT